MIYIGADHGGFKLKQTIIQWLQERNLPFTDVGAHEFDAEDDYPQFAFAVARAVAENPEVNKGVLACRSGAGVMIAANKVAGVRAICPHNTETAKHSREHNGTNVIALSGDDMSEEEAKEVLFTWIETEASQEERHKRRRAQIQQYELEHITNQPK